MSERHGSKDRVESMDTNQADRTLCIKVKHVGKYVDFPGRSKKAAVGIYAGALSSSPQLFFWGWRWITNTEGLFAACIDMGLDELFPEDDSPSLDVVVENDGFKTYLTKYTHDWIARNGRNPKGEIPDQYEHWSNVYQKFEIAKVKVSNFVVEADAEILEDLADRLKLIEPIALGALAGKFDAPPQDRSGDAVEFERWLGENVEVMQCDWQNPAS